MDPIKSIAIAPTRSRKDRKPRAAGHPAPHADSRIGGSVGPVRRRELAAPASPLPLYHVGQRLMLQGGGNRWARAQALCSVLAVLPRESGTFHYRIRSEAESYERVVSELDLEPAA